LGLGQTNVLLKSTTPMYKICLTHNYGQVLGRQSVKAFAVTQFSCSYVVVHFHVGCLMFLGRTLCYSCSWYSVSLMGCLHDPANVQQTFSKCNAGRLLEVRWTFAAMCYNGAGRLLDRVNTLLLSRFTFTI